MTLHGNRRRSTRLATAPALCAAGLLAGCTLDNLENLGRDLADTGSVVHVEPVESGPSAVLDAGEVVDVDRKAPAPDATLPSMPVTCAAGTYIGTFQATPEAFPSEVGSALLGVLGVLLPADGGTASWSGEVFITLVGPGGGLDSGSNNTADLAISGAWILGGDVSSGTLIEAALVGTLDCQSKAFSAELEMGTLANVSTAFLDAGLALPLTGTLSATYDGTMTPPALTNGQIHLVVNPYVETIGGIWSATLM
jgi:hypothetical protein